MSVHDPLITQVSAAAARAHSEGDNDEAHAAFLSSIQLLQLAAEEPAETAKRILYQVSVSLQRHSLRARFLIASFGA